MFEANDVDVGKTTHAGRAAGAMHARENGASVAGTKALGGWSEGGALRSCYDRSFPLDAIWAVAGFNGHDLDSYHVPRAKNALLLLLVCTLPGCPLPGYPLPGCPPTAAAASSLRARGAVDGQPSAVARLAAAAEHASLGAEHTRMPSREMCLGPLSDAMNIFLFPEPPQELLRQLSPWLEEERVKLQERRAANSNAVDFALSTFLSCLEWFREVLLQDAAALKESEDWKKFGAFQSCPVFLSSEFNHFADSLNKAVKTHNSESARQLAQMPQHLSVGVKLALTELKTEADRANEEINAKLDEQNQEINNKLDRVLLLLQQQNPCVDPFLLAHDARAALLQSAVVPIQDARASLFQTPVGQAPAQPIGGVLAPVAPSPVAADDRQKDGEQQQEMARLMAKEVERWGQAAVDANQPWRFDQGKRALFPAYQFTTSPSVRDVWVEYTEGSNGRW
ncbi:hypothetical protein OC842_007735, partial [Tilletia horrida]